MFSQVLRQGIVMVQNARKGTTTPKPPPKEKGKKEGKKKKEKDDDDDNDENDHDGDIDATKENTKDEDGDDQDELLGGRKKFVNIRYRQWLYDRIDGIPRPRAGKHDIMDPYPPSVICLPPKLIQCCPWLLEENFLCTLVGRCGFCSSDENWARRAVMRYALFLNGVGLCLGVFTCLSIADSNYELLQYSALATAQLTSIPSNVAASPIVLNVGLSAFTVHNPNSGLKEIVRFDQFCDMVGNGLEQYIQDPPDQTCGHCEDVRLQTVIGLLVAVGCYLPSMVVNCSRMYRTTDLNFQKVWGTFLSCLSLAGFVLMYVQFTYNCIRDVFMEGEIAYAPNGEVTEVDSLAEYVRFDFSWTVGYGMLTLYAAFGLKLVDFICNCCIPTPAITRNTYDQKVYETKVKEIMIDGYHDPDQDDQSENDRVEDPSASSITSRP